MPQRRQRHSDGPNPPQPRATYTIRANNHRLSDSNLVASPYAYGNQHLNSSLHTNMDKNHKLSLARPKMMQSTKILPTNQHKLNSLSSNKGGRYPGEAFVESYRPPQNHTNLHHHSQYHSHGHGHNSHIHEDTDLSQQHRISLPIHTHSHSHHILPRPNPLAPLQSPPLSPSTFNPNYQDHIHHSQYHSHGHGHNSHIHEDFDFSQQRQISHPLPTHAHANYILHRSDPLLPGVSQRLTPVDDNYQDNIHHNQYHSHGHGHSSHIHEDFDLKQQRQTLPQSHHVLPRPDPLAPLQSPLLIPGAYNPNYQNRIHHSQYYNHHQSHGHGHNSHIHEDFDFSQQRQISHPIPTHSRHALPRPTPLRPLVSPHVSLRSFDPNYQDRIHHSHHQSHGHGHSSHFHENFDLSQQRQVSQPIPTHSRSHHVLHRPRLKTKAKHPNNILH